MKPKNNAALYRKLSEPYAGIDLANDSLQKFGEELHELRLKYKIRDLVCIVQVPVIEASGEEADQIASMMFGDSAKNLVMTATALGTQQAEMDSIIRRAAKGAR